MKQYAIVYFSVFSAMFLIQTNTFGFGVALVGSLVCGWLETRIDKKRAELKRKKSK